MELLEELGGVLSGVLGAEGAVEGGEGGSEVGEVEVGRGVEGEGGIDNLIGFWYDVLFEFVRSSQGGRNEE